jgi:hypothetical protein
VVATTTGAFELAMIAARRLTTLVVLIIFLSTIAIISGSCIIGIDSGRLVLITIIVAPVIAT